MQPTSEIMSKRLLSFLLVPLGHTLWKKLGTISEVRLPWDHHAAGKPGGEAHGEAMWSTVLIFKFLPGQVPDMSVKKPLEDFSPNHWDTANSELSQSMSQTAWNRDEPCILCPFWILTPRIHEHNKMVGFPATKLVLQWSKEQSHWVTTIIATTGTIPSTMLALCLYNGKHGTYLLTLLHSD